MGFVCEMEQHLPLCLTNNPDILNKSLELCLLFATFEVLLESNKPKAPMAATDFNTRVYNFSQDLKPVALNLTKDSERAKDLMQETMLRAISSRDKFREGTNLKAWLYTIMKNIFINDYRRKVKRKTMVDSTDNNFYINSSPANEARNDGYGNLQMDDIHVALEEINPDFKVPFLMHYKGFKYQEIADEFQVPIGTVKSRIHFARKQLKKLLKEMRQ